MSERRQHKRKDFESQMNYMQQMNAQSNLSAKLGIPISSHFDVTNKDSYNSMRVQGAKNTRQNGQKVSKMVKAPRKQIRGGSVVLNQSINENVQKYSERVLSINCDREFIDLQNQSSFNRHHLLQAQPHERQSSLTVQRQMNDSIMLGNGSNAMMLSNQRNKENEMFQEQKMERSAALDRSYRSVPGSAGLLMTNPNFSKTAVGFLYKKHAMEMAKEVSLRQTIQNTNTSEQFGAKEFIQNQPQSQQIMTPQQELDSNTQARLIQMERINQRVVAGGGSMCHSAAASGSYRKQSHNFQNSNMIAQLSVSQQRSQKTRDLYPQKSKSVHRQYRQRPEEFQNSINVPLNSQVHTLTAPQSVWMPVEVDQIPQTQKQQEILNSFTNQPSMIVQERTPCKVAAQNSELLQGSAPRKNLSTIIGAQYSNSSTPNIVRQRENHLADHNQPILVKESINRQEESRHSGAKKQDQSAFTCHRSHSATPQKYREGSQKFKQERSCSGNKASGLRDIIHVRALSNNSAGGQRLSTPNKGCPRQKLFAETSEFGLTSDTQSANQTMLSKRMVKEQKGVGVNNSMGGDETDSMDFNLADGVVAQMQQIQQSLEVCEEVSNDDASPELKSKKRLKNCSSSPVKDIRGLQRLDFEKASESQDQDTERSARNGDFGFALNLRITNLDSPRQQDQLAVKNSNSCAMEIKSEGAQIQNQIQDIGEKSVTATLSPRNTAKNIQINPFYQLQLQALISQIKPFQPEISPEIRQQYPFADLQNTMNLFLSGQKVNQDNDLEGLMAGSVAQENGHGQQSLSTSGSQANPGGTSSQGERTNQLALGKDTILSNQMTSNQHLLSSQGSSQNTVTMLSSAQPANQQSTAQRLQNGQQVQPNANQGGLLQTPAKQDLHGIAQMSSSGQAPQRAILVFSNAPNILQQTPIRQGLQQSAGLNGGQMGPRTNMLTQEKLNQNRIRNQQLQQAMLQSGNPTLGNATPSGVPPNPTTPSNQIYATPMQQYGAGGNLLQNQRGSSHNQEAQGGGNQDLQLPTLGQQTVTQQQFSGQRPGSQHRVLVANRQQMHIQQAPSVTQVPINSPTDNLIQGPHQTEESISQNVPRSFDIAESRAINTAIPPGSSQSSHKAGKATFVRQSQHLSGSQGISAQNPSTAGAGGQMKTYKEIRQRLQQKQQMEMLRQQQQAWIAQQQVMLAKKNPGATMEQINSAIQQQILIQSQQFAQQQQLQHQQQQLQLQQQNQQASQQQNQQVKGQLAPQNGQPQTAVQENQSQYVLQQQNHQRSPNQQESLNTQNVQHAQTAQGRPQQAQQVQHEAANTQQSDPQSSQTQQQSQGQSNYLQGATLAYATLPDGQQIVYVHQPNSKEQTPVAFMRLRPVVHQNGQQMAALASNAGQIFFKQTPKGQMVLAVSSQGGTVQLPHEETAQQIQAFYKQQLIIAHQQQQMQLAERQQQQVQDASGGQLQSDEEGAKNRQLQNNAEINGKNQTSGGSENTEKTKEEKSNQNNPTQASRQQNSTGDQKSQQQTGSNQNHQNGDKGAQNNLLQVAQNSSQPPQMSYTQLLKQECAYEPVHGMGSQVINKPVQHAVQATNMPLENLKHALQQLTSEILRKVLARSDSMNQLRQIIDLKGKKVKPKNYDSQIFTGILEKEAQRVHQENISLSKSMLKIEDKTLIKVLQKNAKKMLKPFKGLNYDDFLNNEIHLNEIMATQDQVNDPIKESRKRHLRILDAALKEQVVDTQIVLGICVQISRQAFYNELLEYFQVAFEYITTNQSQFQSHDIQGIHNVKKKIGGMKANMKVSINQTKKMDRMFWLLVDQNQEVRNNIMNYKARCKKKTNEERVGSMGPRMSEDPHNLLQPPGSQDRTNSNTSGIHIRRQNTGFNRSSSGVNNIAASPKVNGPGSSHNIFANQNGTGAMSAKGHSTDNRTVRASVALGQSGTNNGGNKLLIDTACGQARRTANRQNRNSQNTNDLARNGEDQSLKSSNQNPLHSQTASKNQPLQLPLGRGKNQLAPLTSSSKKAQTIIQKKIKAKDLDKKDSGENTRAQNRQNQPIQSVQSAAISKKEGKSTLVQVRAGRQKNMNLQMSQANDSSKMSGLAGATTSESTNVGQATERIGTLNQDKNSTENLFNLIQSKKTKNTMILEPLGGAGKGNTATRLSQKFKGETSLGIASIDTKNGGQDDIGAGLQTTSDKNLLRNTEYGTGFGSKPSNMPVRTIKEDPLDPDSPNKVLRQWSRPQIQNLDINNSDGEENDDEMQARMQRINVCTCARYRKRIDRPAESQMIASLSEKLASNDMSKNESSDFGQDGNQLEKHLSNIVRPPTSPTKGSQRAFDSDPGSPDRESNNTRMSQDFKMRILTKKKVKVTSNNGSSALKMPIRLREIVNQKAQLLDAHPYSSEKDKQKVVTYELCTECGGQRPVGLPLVENSISDLQIKLNVENLGKPGKRLNFETLNKDDSSEKLGTARLNDSDKQSTLSMGRGEEEADNNSQGNVPRGNQNHQTQKSEKRPLLLINLLNPQYIHFIGASNRVDVQELIAYSRAARIQGFYRQRHAIKVQAVILIQQKWRFATKMRCQWDLRKARIEHLREQAAIKKLVRLFRLIRVKKVSASALLMAQQLDQGVQNLRQNQKDPELFDQYVIKIQRAWRTYRAQKYDYGCHFAAITSRKQSLWTNVVQTRGNGLQNVQGDLLWTAMMHSRENKNLEMYFWKQMVNYAKDLETKAAKIEQRVNTEFSISEWTFNTNIREWSNSRTNITIKLDRTDSQQVNTLKEKIVQFYIRTQMPVESTINASLDDFVSAKNAMIRILKKDVDHKANQLLDKIKRKRYQALGLQALPSSQNVGASNQH